MERDAHRAGRQRAPHPAAPEAEGSVWHNGDFVRFWAGQGVSQLGSQVTNLALPLAAMGALDATSQQVGLLRFVELAPYLLLSLPFGVWVDRGRRRPVMMLANAARMLLVLAVPVLAHLGWLRIDGLLVLACAAGGFSVLFDVSWMSYLPVLVRRQDQFVDANQALGVTQSTTDLAGPGLAGLLIGWLGPSQALLVDAASYLASLAGLAGIRTREPAPTPAPNRSFRRELAEGVGWVFGHPVLRPLALVAPFTNFSLTCVGTLFLLFGVRVHQLTPAAMGLVFSVSAVGALLGSLASKRAMARFPLGPLYVCSLAALYAAPLLLPLARGSRVAVVCQFVASLLLCYLGSGLSNVVQLSIRQTCTPTALLGRMSAAFRTLLFGGGALGALCAGLLGQHLGVPRALLLVTACSAAAVVPIALSPVARLRDMPPAADDHSGDAGTPG